MPYENDNKREPISKVMLTMVTDLEFELSCLNIYLKIIKHFKKMRETKNGTTTLE